MDVVFLLHLRMRILTVGLQVPNLRAASEVSHIPPRWRRRGVCTARSVHCDTPRRDRFVGPPPPRAGGVPLPLLR
jgi:hypothetical protein